jgi:hypothetical protein
VSGKSPVAAEPPPNIAVPGIPVKDGGAMLAVGSDRRFASFCKAAGSLRSRGRASHQCGARESRGSFRDRKLCGKTERWVKH